MQFDFLFTWIQRFRVRICKKPDVQTSVKVFCGRTRRSGTKGIVDFSLDPIVYELQKANRESLEFCWMMKLPWRREKIIAICRVQKDPCPIFQIWEKTLVAIFYLRSRFMFSWTSQGHWKIWEKLPNAGEPMSDFLRMLENTYRIFFQFKKVKKFIEFEKRSVRL